MNKSIITVIAGLSFLMIISCTQQSENQPGNTVFTYTNHLDINYGEDICAYTDEPIERVRFGGRIEMNDGEVLKFMSAEATAGYYLEMENRDHIKSIEIVDFAHGQQYLPVDELVYLQSKLQPSPNGLFLTPVDASNEKMKTYIYDAYPGTFYSWDEVLELVSEEWDLPAADA